jgi:large subunit ribosomal protein L9
MKVILRQDVEKLGEKGTVQTVSDGFARNYLIPKGLAVLATSGELRHLEDLREVQERKIAKQEQQLQTLADRIDGMTLTFVARAGEQGRLYGSVTAGDIAERLAAAVKHEIDRRKVILEEPIRQVGEHMVTVNLVGRLKPQVRIVVESEAGAEEATAEPQPKPKPPAEEAVEA